MNRRKQGFTLIELIVVIAITAVLLGIIAVPLIQSLNTTRAAQGFADAQNRARVLIDQITREVSNAAYVRDNSGSRGEVTVVIPRSAADPTPVRVRLANARLDIMAPAQGDPLRAPGGGLVNPDTGLVDPTLRTPRGDVNLPVTEGFRLIRYFVGLRQPFRLGPNGTPLATPAPYNNPYDGILTPREGSQDNLFVLYRAEMDLRVYDPVTDSWKLNPEVLGFPQTATITPQQLEDALNDPEFFVFGPNNSTWGGDLLRINAWLRRSRVVTEISRYDMIQVVIDRRTRAIQTFTDPVDNVVKPRVVSLVQFTPNRVNNEPMGGMQAVRSGEEAPNAAKIGPDVFMADFGNVSSPFLRVRPSTYRIDATTIADPWAVWAPWQSGRAYMIGRDRPTTTPNPGFSVYNYTTGSETTAGVEVFDAAGYLFARDFDRNQALPPDPDNPVTTVSAQFRYPFSWAVQRAATRAGGNNLLTNAQLAEDFIPFAVDREGGRVVASFGIDEVGTVNALPAGVDSNRPASATGDAVPPAQDPLVAGAPAVGRWAGAEFDPSLTTSRINQRFNILWNDWDVLAPQLDRTQAVRRFVDLRVTSQLDGELSPLDPRRGWVRARIVPGSEIVIGPDQTPGPNYGQPVRYTRISTPGNVGPNQYFINYVNQPEPNWAQLGLAVSPSLRLPNTYVNTGTNWADRLVSQILQPRYRAGYLEFNSLPGEPLPAGTISVFYRFQFTDPNDVVEMEYDSRSMINIGLTVRNFPQTTAPNQQNVTVRGQAAVRNIRR